ncbi:MAG: hypothetical protein ACFE8M_06315 [Candidatus Hermodarchaeota archaeon]
MTTYFAPLIHIYQPPTQDIQVLKRINEECYKPLFSLIKEYDRAKFCLNINGILIEMLYEYNLGDTIQLIKDLVAENKIEIVGTAKFHPILPLIPRKEAYHQIQMNEEVNFKIFGKRERKGFFPPELSINSKVAKFLRDLGYKWVILSGIACPVEWPYDKIFTSPNGLLLYFRDDILSNKISFKHISAKEFVKDLKTTHKDSKQKNANNTYIITAMDGETFGHHVKNYEKTFLGKTIELISEEKNIEMTFISDLDNYFPKAKKNIIPNDSSWSTTYDDLKSGIPYPLWRNPDNIIHKYYWKIMNSLHNLMNIADSLDFTQNWDIENYYKTARYFYDRGLHSCPVWWANPDRGIWSPNLIYNGVELLIKTALNAQMALVHSGKSEMGEVYFDAISYYHGLLLMELYNITRKNLKKFNGTKIE